MRMGKIWLLGLLAIASPAMAQNDNGLNARRAAVQQLLELRNEDKHLDTMAGTLANLYVERLRKARPEISQEQLDALDTTIKADLLASQDDYLRPEIASLSQRLTMEDLQAAIAFYRTPAGKKLSAIATDLIPDIAKAQTDWVSAAVLKATNEVNAKATK
jgi:hypothetical protein